MPTFTIVGHLLNRLISYQGWVGRVCDDAVKLSTLPVSAKGDVVIAYDSDEPGDGFREERSGCSAIFMLDGIKDHVSAIGSHVVSRGRGVSGSEWGGGYR